jgi:hypothetical protein
MKQLPIALGDERTALQARWPEAVLALSDEERARRVRAGTDSVMLDDEKGKRGFVRAVLTVPLGHPRASVYGVFVEVDRTAYTALRKANASGTPTRVWGKLATRVPYLDGAIGADVEIVEDGSEKRCRVVAANSALIVDGPPVGALR